jgi:sugar phosphate isomerase/epimerase
MQSLGLGHFTFLDQSPVDLVRLARRVGFAFVGLRFHPVARGQLNWLPDAAGLRELQQVMQGEGVTLYDIETVVIDAALDPRDLLGALEAAATLGARRLNTCADLFDDLPDTFARICALAESFDMGVDLECMAWRGLNTPAACLDLIDRAGAPNAAYLVDALHHFRCGGTVQMLRDLPATRIASAQLCDAPLTPPQGTYGLLAEARGGRLLPDAGGLALRDLVAALPADTVISVELPNATDLRPPLERARAIHAATFPLLNKAAPCP